MEVLKISEKQVIVSNCCVDSCCVVSFSIHLHTCVTSSIDLTNEILTLPSHCNHDHSFNDSYPFSSDVSPPIKM